TEFRESWQDFYSGNKSGAYWEDSLVTTHPIEASVTRVKDTFANFDSITYGKGASVLKQLWAYIGFSEFKKGLRTYIKTYAYQNTNLSQLMTALQSETKQDLTAWSDLWLRQSGADTLSAKWTCEGSSLK